MRSAILACLLVMGLWIPACDSPHRRPPVDADADADADAEAPDADVPDNGDVVDVPDFDIPDGWPARDECKPQPTHGLEIGGNPFFFSVPHTWSGISIALTEYGHLLSDIGRSCTPVNGYNAWGQDLYSYDLVQRVEESLVMIPAPQFHPNEYNGRIFYSNSYVDYQPASTKNPWEGNPNIWVLENGIPQVYTTWCPSDYGCVDSQISKAGKMVYFEYDPDASPLLVRMMFHDLNTLETRLIDDQHETPMVFDIGDRAVFWNYGPCDAFRYYDIERDLIVENPAYSVFAAKAWGKYLAWGNCSPIGQYVMDVETGVVRILDEELNLDPETRYAIHTGYENLVAAVDQSREVPEPGKAAHLWLYDLDTRVERRITSEPAKWTWGGYKIINCEWAIVSLQYAKDENWVITYLGAALNLQQAGILDENCHIIPGPPLEFTLEEFITASGFTLEGYDPVYN